MNLIKKSMANVFIYGCGLIIVNGLSFLMLPFYTRQFLPEQYALIVMLFVCLPFSRYTLPLEISQAAPVFSNDDIQKAPTYIAIGFYFTLSINLACYSLLLLFNQLLHFIDLSSFELLIVFLLLACDCLFYYSSNILRWQLRPYLYNGIIAGAASLEVILTFIFVLVEKLSILGVFYAWLISRFLGLLCCLIFNRKNYAFTFDFKLLKLMLSFSIPLVFSNIAYNINRAFDRWVVSAMIGLSAVGIYGAGATIGGIINLIMASMSAALTPLIYKNHADKNAPAAITRLFYMVITFCLVIAMTLTLFNNDLLYYLVAKNYYLPLTGQPIVPIFVLTSIFSGLFIFAPGLAVKKKTIYVVWFNLVALSVNTFLAMILVRILGMTGVAFATLMSICLSSFLYLTVSQRYYKLLFQTRHVLSLLTFFLAFYAMAIWLSLVMPPWQLQSALLKILFDMIFCLLAWSLLRKICKELSGVPEHLILQYGLMDEA